MPPPIKIKGLQGESITCSPFLFLANITEYHRKLLIFTPKSRPKSRPLSLWSPTNFHTTFLRMVRLTFPFLRYPPSIGCFRRVHPSEATESAGQENIVLLSVNEWSGCRVEFFLVSHKCTFLSEIHDFKWQSATQAHGLETQTYSFLIFLDNCHRLL